MTAPKVDQAVLYRVLPSLFLLLLLAACRPAARIDLPEQVDADVRAQQLLQVDHWQLQGRVAISDGRDGGSGRLDWLQQQQRFELNFRAPVTGRTWRLTGDAEGALLEGLRAEVLWDRDVASLLARELDWPVPVDALGYWVRGLRAPGAHGVLERDARGLPSRLQQHGWLVQYQDWTLADELVLPRRMSAERADFRLRLVVDGWTLHTDLDHAEE